MEAGSCLCRWSARCWASPAQETPQGALWVFFVLVSDWAALTPDLKMLVTVLITGAIQRRQNFMCLEATTNTVVPNLWWESRVVETGSSMASLCWLGAARPGGLAGEGSMSLQPCSPQIEEALVRRKKMELLHKYASETLQAQSEEARRLLGY